MDVSVLKIPLFENSTVLLNFDDCVYKIKFLCHIKRERVNEEIYLETSANIQICLVLQELIREMKSNKNIKNIDTEYFMVQTEIKDWLLGSVLKFKSRRTFLDHSYKVIVLKFQIKDFLLKQEKKDHIMLTLDNNTNMTPNAHNIAKTSYENLVSNHDVVQIDLTPPNKDQKFLVHPLQSSEIENFKVLMLATPKLGSENYRSLNLKKRRTVAEIVHTHDVMINKDKVSPAKSSPKKQELLSAGKFFKNVGSEQIALSIVSHQHPKEKIKTTYKTEHYHQLDYTCKMEKDNRKTANNTFDNFQDSKHDSYTNCRKVNIPLMSSLPNTGINFKAQLPVNSRQQKNLRILDKNEFEKIHPSLSLENVKSNKPQENKCTEKIKKNYFRMKYKTFGELMPSNKNNELKNFSVPEVVFQQGFTSEDHQKHSLDNASFKILKNSQVTNNIDIRFNKKLKENQRKSSASDLPEYLPHRKRKNTISFTNSPERTSSKNFKQNKSQKISLLDFFSFPNIFNCEIVRTDSYLQKNKEDNNKKIISSVNPHSFCSEPNLGFLQTGKSACVLSNYGEFQNANLDQNKPDFYSDDVKPVQQKQCKYYSCDHIIDSGLKDICTHKFINYNDIQDTRNVFHSKSKDRNIYDNFSCIQSSFKKENVSYIPNRLSKDDICLLGSPEIKLLNLKVTNVGYFET